MTDSFLQTEVLHRFFLCDVHCDTLARNSLYEFNAVSSFFPCYRCWFEGCKYEESKKGTFFLGYNSPAPQNVRRGGQKLLAKDALRRTHADHVVYGKRVEAQLENPEE